MGKHAHCQRREQHKQPRASHAAPQLGRLLVAHDNADGRPAAATVNRGLHTRNAGNDRLRQAALQHVADQTPPAEILEPRGQNPAQQLKEQRCQRQ